MNQQGSGDPISKSRFCLWEACATSLVSCHEIESSLTGIIVLDKLERKFGGERFNDPNNEAKNRAMNQKLSKRIRQVAKMAM